MGKKVYWDDKTRRFAFIRNAVISAVIGVLIEALYGDTDLFGIILGVWMWATLCFALLVSYDPLLAPKKEEKKCNRHGSLILIDLRDR